MKKQLYFGIIVIIALGGLYFFLNRQSNSSASPIPQLSPSAKPIIVSKHLVIKNQKIASGSGVVTVNQGDQVSLFFASDVKDEVHLHGYDLSAQLDPAKEVELSFVADKTGRFEYELEDSKVELGALEVQPKL